MSASPWRAPRPEDAVLGRRPAAVVEPATVEEAAAAVGETARDGRSLLFVGGGTDLEVGGVPESLDVLLSTRRLDRVVEHAPSDQIAVVEAGVTLAALGRVLARHGQRLALDPPLPERATVGGVVAANAFGPRRARYGAARDLLIGVTLVRADGVVARGGGKVVKNVAGFDVPRLMAGSLGTLGLVATATFRLHPLPEASATVAVPALAPASLRALLGRARDAQLEPDSVVAFRVPGRGFDLAVRFEGFRHGVAQQRDRFARLAAEGGAPGVETLDEDAAGKSWARHDAIRRAGTVRVKIAALPSAIESVERDVFAPLLSAFGGGDAVWYPTLGLGFAGGSPAEEPGMAEALASARRTLAAGGGSLVVLAAPDAVRAATDPWGPPPAALPLLRAVKDRFDPARRLAPGRFVGGI